MVDNDTRIGNSSMQNLHDFTRLSFEDMGCGGFLKLSLGDLS